MGTTNESDELVVVRLASRAGSIIEMLKASFMTKDKRLDMTFPLIFAAGLAGHACIEAVKANKEELVCVTTADHRNYYYGDAINAYLLENKTSVYSFCNAVTGMTDQQLMPLVAGISQKIGTESLTIGGMEADSVYEQIKPCWDGIFNNMTAKYCQSPAEWPILFGIVLQNMIKQSIDVGAPVNEVAKLAMECAIVMSKMDQDSIIKKPTDNYEPAIIVTDKKIINKVCGKNGAMEAFLIGVMIFLIILIFGVVALAIGFGASRGIAEAVPFIFMIGLLAAVVAIYAVMSVNTIRHRKELTKKYHLLSPNQQQEILNLATNTKAPRMIYYTKHFVYGNMYSLKSMNGIPTKGLVFEYAKLEDIAWIFTLKKVNFMAPEDTCCIYTKDGICYKGMLNKTYLDDLGSFIREVNPDILVGYTDENKRAYANLRNNN